jgi:hypothetical protein
MLQNRAKNRFSDPDGGAAGQNDSRFGAVARPRGKTVVVLGRWRCVGVKKVLLRGRWGAIEPKRLSFRSAGAPAWQNNGRFAATAPRRGEKSTFFGPLVCRRGKTTVAPTCARRAMPKWQLDCRGVSPAGQIE